MNINRRFFLKTMTPFLLLIYPFKHLLAFETDINEKHLFLDESNTFEVDSIFVLGLLSCDNLSKSQNDIKNIRIKNHYRTELTYRSTDKFKVQYTKDLIDYFFNEPTLKFSARVITGNIDYNRDDYYAKKKSTYQSHYKQIIDDSVPDNNKKLFIHLEKRSLTGADKKLSGFLERKFDSTIEHITRYRKSDLSQLSDLLTGCINGDIHNSAKIPISNSSKIEVIQYIKTKIGINNFSDIYNRTNDQKFRIVQTHI